MEESEKMLEVAETTDGVVEETTATAEEPVENKEEEFTDSNSKETVEEKTEESVENPVSDDSKKETQTRDENSKYAQARRKAEEEFKKKESDAYKRGKIEAYKGKLNPYTQTVISDENDFEVYESMCEIANNGGDPIADFIQYTTDKKREEQKKLQEKEKITEEAKKDIEDFSNKYPDVDLSKLLNNEDFKDYIDGKRKPLVELYEKYRNLENRFRTSGVEIAKKTIANSQATPGSLNGGGEHNIDFETMGNEEFDKYLQAVKNGEIK